MESASVPEKNVENARRRSIVSITGAAAHSPTSSLGSIGRSVDAAQARVPQRESFQRGTQLGNPPQRAERRARSPASAGNARVAHHFRN